MRMPEAIRRLVSWCRSAGILGALLVGSACQPPATGTPSPSLRPCDATAPESFPCLTPFDEPPQLEPAPEPAAGRGEQRTLQVWVFVTEAGVVGTSQMQRVTEISFDAAATGRARQLRFTPATLGGRPVPAWILVPITTTAATSCPTMDVPLSAGDAILVDSMVLERPELGTVYRYETIRGLPIDLFLYPAEPTPSPEREAARFLESLELMRAQGDLKAFEVVRSGQLQIRVSREARPDTTMSGHEVRVRLEPPQGEPVESWFAVFDSYSRYLKVRASYQPKRGPLAVLQKFVSQVLSSRASTPAECR